MICVCLIRRTFADILCVIAGGSKYSIDKFFAFNAQGQFHFLLYNEGLASAIYKFESENAEDVDRRRG